MLLFLIKNFLKRTQPAAGRYRRGKAIGVFRSKGTKIEIYLLHLTQNFQKKVLTSPQGKV